MTATTRKILAIGGGEIGRPKEDGSGYYPIETTLIDKEILRLTSSKAATLLFIPTASGDSRHYFDLVKKHFLKIGFASVDVLYLLDESLTKTQIEEAILSHDAIYIGGGNTLSMMEVWRELGVDKILKQALDKGIVLSGLSAGSICWFSQGCSDSGDSDMLINVAGLGFIDAAHCPHYDAEPQSRSEVKRMMMDSAKVAICLGNCAALEIVGNEYRIIKSKPTAQAYRAYWKNKQYYEEEIVVSDSFKDIARLLTK
jgi:dipeptidase E